ncbi:DNA helicase RecQ [Methylocella silvestris]|uniref:DNA helicase RecQ n=1 Tax=Methylocella silvestris TaxID=199596 RepID=A0A2J7TMD9_METSI|nr:DNA helicase RecQ [Methylocella silvestris]PNG27945.1 DNA helicase RecQ [Methylocella silvestris]
MQSSDARTPAAPSTEKIEAPGRSGEARDALKRFFGFDDFRPGQREVLDAALAGENILAVMPTGSGKSLCYQLPALMRPGLTIVVSPLIALMRDQVQQLRERGIAAAALNSVNSSADNAEIEAGLRQRRYRLVYVAPERLARADTRALLREAGANVLAIDEAHCVSQWGHDFRPEYADLSTVARSIAGGEGGALQLIAVTATADPPTRAEIIAKLFPSAPRVFIRSFDRPNIHLAMRRKANVLSQIATEIDRHRGEAGIVYCASRKGVEKLSETLRAAGVPALPYHAGLAPDIRSAHQDEFLHREGVVIVATIAFGMGIDKPNVRFVCHADLPQSVEAYYQEIGRAGRDGRPADALLLFGEADVRLRERQIAEGEAAPERKRLERRKLNALLALCETPRCRRRTLLAAFGEESGPCGNCDICEGRWPFYNGALAAKKALSAIHRTSGRFFYGHLANLLIGNATAAIVRHGHELLPTFGVGKEFTPAEWRSVFRQLQAAELIEQAADDRDRWIITPAGRDVLTGGAALELRAEIGLPSGRRMGVTQALQRIEAVATEEDAPVGERETRRERLPDKAADLTAMQARLFSALKARRLEIARAQKQPPFVIFHDSVLIAMARARPLSLGDLALVHGVGPAKLQRYGAAFLDVLAGHEGAN